MVQLVATLDPINLEADLAQREAKARDKPDAIAGLIGGDADDVLRGDAGENLLNGYGGDDWLQGGGGDDTLIGGAGNDTLEGGAGKNTADYSSDSAGFVFDFTSGVLTGADVGVDLLIGMNIIQGGAGDDVMTAEYATDAKFIGGAGDDQLYGRTHNDVLVGGDGDDWLDGHDGFDAIYGGTGDNILIGAIGPDWLLDGMGDSELVGGVDYDRLFGGGGQDILSGDDGDDLADGGAGDDDVRGGEGLDTIQGGGGVDWLFGGADADTIEGGDDDDKLIGGFGDDALFGDAGDDVLIGGSGADKMTGGEGADLYVYRDAEHTSSTDADVITGFDFNEDRFDLSTPITGIAAPIVRPNLFRLSFYLNAEVLPAHHALLMTVDSETYRAGTYLVADLDGVAGFTEGVDLIVKLEEAVGVDAFDLADFTVLDGGAGREFGAGADRATTPDWQLSAGGQEPFVGGEIADRLRGSAGVDRIGGLDGDDTLAGGGGDDTLVGGVGDDLADLSDAVLDLVVDLGAGTATDAGGEVDKLVQMEGVWAGAGDDRLVGRRDAANVLIGGAGDDTAVGGRQADQLSGGEGNDSLEGGEGDDALYGDMGDNTLIGGGGDDWLIDEFGDTILDGGEGDDTLFGGFGNDSIEGGAGDDMIHGWMGVDTIHGGEGNDKLIGKNGDDLLYGGTGDDELQGGENEDLLIGGAGIDDMEGHSGLDTLEGGAEADLISGGEDADIFIFRSAGDSSEATCDWVDDLDFTDDHFDLWVEVTSIAAPVEVLTFTDIADGLSSDVFARGAAALISTSDDGRLFLAVNTDEVAGYQSADLLVEITAAVNLHDFGLDFFI